MNNWIAFRSKYEEDNISEQIIWNNKDITVDNKSIFYNYLFYKNIIFIKDLLLEKSFDELLNLLSEKGVNTKRYLELYSLRSAIPMKLKQKRSPENQVLKDYRGTYAFNTWRTVPSTMSIAM